ncbi:MAG TPA: hypothetical protein V6D17_05705, partial [Candidatus Obscuribacterales bacterium]
MRITKSVIASLFRFLPLASDWTRQARTSEKQQLPDLWMVLLYLFFTGFWNAIVGIFAMVMYVL